MSVATKAKFHKIYSPTIDGATRNQFFEALAQPFAVRGALMPDAHLGYSMPIGGVIATDNHVVPAWVGFDIGCGVCAIQTTFPKAEIVKYRTELFSTIYQTIPLGYNHNVNPTPWDYKYIKHTQVVDKIMTSKNGLTQLGSLGGGNHFIEIGVSTYTDDTWVVIHSGSRGIGHAVATHYMKLASGTGKAKEGHYAFDINTQEGRDCLDDMNYCLAFALENRRIMLERIGNIIGAYCNGDLLWDTLINKTHNHAEVQDSMVIHRKGATQARLGDMGVIPGNMREGSFIVKGLGNPEALYSSSHGAGRRLGRNQAKQELTLDGFLNSMEGITANVSMRTLDEAPDAYKNIYEVMEAQSDLVEICDHIKPLINVKG